MTGNQFVSILIVGILCVLGAIGYLIITAPPTYTKAEQWRMFTIVSIKPPKHFYVTVKDESTTYPQMYVSKHCNGWEKNQAGDKVRGRYRELETEGRRRIVIDGMKEQLCGVRK